MVWVTIAVLVHSVQLRLLVVFWLHGTSRLVLGLGGAQILLLDRLLIHKDQQLIPIGFLVIISSLKLLTRLLLDMVVDWMVSGILCDFGGYEYLFVFLSIVCFLDYGITLNCIGWLFVIDAPFSHFVLFHVDRQDLFLYYLLLFHIVHVLILLAFFDAIIFVIAFFIWCRVRVFHLAGSPLVLIIFPLTNLVSSFIAPTSFVEVLHRVLTVAAFTKCSARNGPLKAFAVFLLAFRSLALAALKVHVLVFVNLGLESKDVPL